MIKFKISGVLAGLCGIGVLAATVVGHAQVVARQAVENGTPQYRVDPFWPKPLPNRWSMQQVTGIYVDQGLRSAANSADSSDTATDGRRRCSHPEESSSP